MKTSEWNWKSQDNLDVDVQLWAPDEVFAFMIEWMSTQLESK